MWKASDACERLEELNVHLRVKAHHSCGRVCIREIVTKRCEGCDGRLSPGNLFVANDR